MSEGTAWALIVGENTLPMVTKKVLRRGTDLKSGGGMVFLYASYSPPKKKNFFFVLLVFLLDT